MTVDHAVSQTTSRQGSPSSELLLILASAKIDFRPSRAVKTSCKMPSFTELLQDGFSLPSRQSSIALACKICVLLSSHDLWTQGGHIYVTTLAALLARQCA